MRASRIPCPDSAQVLEVPPGFEPGNGGFADGCHAGTTANFRRRPRPDAQRGATGETAAGVTAASRGPALQRVLQIVLLSSDSATADVRRVRVATPDAAMALLLRLHAPEAWR